MFPVLNHDYQFWFYFIHAPAGYIYMLAALILLGYSLRKMEGIYRIQGSLLLLAILLPALTDLFYVLGYSPVRNYNFTTAVFGLSARGEHEGVADDVVGDVLGGHVVGLAGDEVLQGDDATGARAGRVAVYARVLPVGQRHPRPPLRAPRSRYRSCLRRG